MPRKKRTTCNPRKAQLRFLENPQQGPIHEYGSIPPKADNPICVPTRPLVDNNTSTTWVSPQFDQIGELHFPARRRLRHASASSTLQSRDTNRSTLKAPGRKPSVCKFPSLSFTGQSAFNGTTSLNSTCTKRLALPAHTKRGNIVQHTPPLQKKSNKTVSPPDLPTPEITPPSLRTVCLTEREDMRQTLILNGQAQECDSYDSPQVTRPGQVLAEDSPEHEYGMRNTWRRRQPLMKYLKARGRLRSSQILVQH
ncbi:RAD9, HUS1, RAD1-interacting nuclear orphan protein 1 [Bombina bombina]|uniref:RAD9, HUS1, RAD1-interacting nuclear orphan protein 1 n=1 Tax=Bombina bombina TaxID=8345 RepID=UPI00235B0E2C|nr:RAD9, HUS1, RAD1-interacting nuclear orphan protein 1 [Bombina bombina]